MLATVVTCILGLCFECMKDLTFRDFDKLKYITMKIYSIEIYSRTIS